MHIYSAAIAPSVKPTQFGAWWSARSDDPSGEGNTGKSWPTPSPRTPGDTADAASSYPTPTSRGQGSTPATRDAELDPLKCIDNNGKLRRGKLPDGTCFLIYIKEQGPHDSARTVQALCSMFYAADNTSTISVIDMDHRIGGKGSSRSPILVYVGPTPIGELYQGGPFPAGSIVSGVAGYPQIWNQLPDLIRRTADSKQGIFKTSVSKSDGEFRFTSPPIRIARIPRDEAWAEAAFARA